MLVISETTPASDEATLLIRELDAELLRLYPPEDIHGLSPEEHTHFEGVFLVAHLDGQLAGCGALRLLGPDAGEIKRMYVRPASRGRAVARNVLAALERHARNYGLTVARLETGTKQEAAQRLYESSGYARIACYGEYAGGSYSVCYEKQLVHPKTME